jgi:hypothetical protein
MKIHRKLLMSIITLVLVITTFTASTYAWIYNTNQVQISGFNFNANSGLGFLISVDDVHYSSDLTVSQIKRAILKSSNPSNYEFNDSGDLTIVGSDVALSDESINATLKNIELRPMTSYNGYQFEGLGNTVITDYHSNCIEFTLYFKTTSNAASDNASYDIYLYGGNSYTSADGKEINPSKMSSTIDTVKLNANMTTGSLVLGEDNSLALNSTVHNQGEEIKVYSVNALRFSAGQVNLKEVVNEETKETTYVETQEDTTQIFEFYNNEDLGSYATNYESDGTEEGNALAKLYDSKMNAGFTYYNNKKSNISQISAIDYDSKPETVRYLVGSEATPEGYIGKKLTTVTSGLGSTKVTFRYWLEGWDADCFDGIASSVSVNLAFVSKQN